MATEREIGVRLRVTASGLEVLDDAGGKVGELERKLDAAGRTGTTGLLSLERASTALGAALGTVVAGGFVLATRAVGDFLDRTGRLNDLSQSVGVLASDLSGLTLAAKTSGVELGALGDGLRFLNQSIAQAAAGSKADADAFGSLGVSVRETNGTLRSAADVLGDVAGAFESLPDGPQKTAVAMQLLGRAGAGLIPVLNLGGQGLAEMRTQAERLGIVLGDDTVAAADDVGDKLDTLRLSIDGLTNAFAAGLLPSLSEATERTLEWREANNGVLTSIAELAGSSLGEFLQSTVRELESLAATYRLVRNAGRALSQYGSDSRFDSGVGQVGAVRALVARLADADTAPGAEITAAVRGVVGPFIPASEVARRQGVTGPVEPDFRYQYALPSSAPAAGEVGPPVPDGYKPPSARRRSGGRDDAARDAERAAADYERRAGDALAEQERVRLALLDAQVAMRERAIDFAEQDLQLAQQAGASQQDQLRLAAQLDTLERERLTATRERLEAELAGLQQFGPVLSEQVVQLQSDLEGVNAELARGPGHVRELATEFANARREATGLSDSFARAIDGLLASGESFDFSKVLRNVLQIDGTQILGDLFAGGAGKLGLQGDNVIELIGDGISKGFASVRDLFGGGAAPAAAGVPSSFVGPPTAAEAAAAQSAGGTQAAAQAGAAAGSAAAAGYAAIIVAGIGALQGGFEAIDEERNKLGATQRSVLLAGAAGALEGSLDAIGFGGIGKSLGGAIRKGGAAGALAIDTLIAPLLTGGLPIPGLSLIAEDIFAGLGLFQPKTRGTVLKKSLGELFTDANLPLQRDVELGGRRGVRTVGIEASPDQATFDAFKALGFDRSGIIENNLLGNPLREAISRNPAVEQFRTAESLGIGAVFAQNPRDASVFANAITSNFQLLGVGADEARRQLLKLAQTAGVDLIGGLEELNKSFLQGQFTQLQLESSAAGLVKLFSADLPAAIDVAKIVADRTNAEGGINIAGVQAGVAGAVSAYGIRRRIEDTRLGFLDPRRQGEEIKRRIAELDVQLADSDLTYGQRQSLLEERADLGFRYVDYAGQRYSGARRRTEQEFGYGVAEGSASQLEDLGKSIKEPTEANTSATSANTTAIDRLTNAILKGVQGRLDVTFAGIPSEDAPAVIATIKRELAEFVKSPEFRAAVRKEGAAP